MVTEGSMRDNEINKCLLEVEDSNRHWKITIIMIIAMGFAAMTFAMWRLYKHLEEHYSWLMEALRQSGQSRTQNGGA